MLLLALLVYHPVHRFDFLNFDDKIFVMGNPWLEQGITRASLAWAFTANLFRYSEYAEYWSPLTLLSRLMDAELFGMDAGAFHVTSAVIHWVNALLLYAALHALTRSRFRSAIVAGLFLVHPLNVEPVAWLSARKDLVGATFFFCTLIAYARYVKLKTTRSYIALLVAFCAALMSKPMSVSVPLVLLILDAWPLRRWPGSGGNAASLRRLLLEKLPLAVLAAGAAALALISQRNWGAMLSTEELPFPYRLGNATVSYALYLRRFIWPDDLAIFYPHPETCLTVTPVLVATAVLMVVSVAVILLRRKMPFLLAGWLWFGIVLGPVIGLVQIGSQALADRYFYTAGVGLMMAAVWAGHHLLQSRRQLSIVAVAAALLALASTALVQVHFWRDSETAFERALVVTERNHIAHLNLGNELMNQGSYLEAQEHLVAALQIKPLDPRVWHFLGSVEMRLGHRERAMINYSRAINLDPGYHAARALLVEALRADGKTEEAEAHRRILMEAGEREGQ